MQQGYRTVEGISPAESRCTQKYMPNVNTTFSSRWDRSSGAQAGVVLQTAHASVNKGFNVQSASQRPLVLGMSHPELECFTQAHSQAAQTRQSRLASHLAQQQQTSSRLATANTITSVSQHGLGGHSLSSLPAQRSSMAEPELTKIPPGTTADSPSATSDMSSDEYFDYLDAFCAKRMDQNACHRSSASSNPEEYTAAMPSATAGQSAAADGSDMYILHEILPNMQGETVVNDEEFGKFLAGIEWAECSSNTFASALEQTHVLPVQYQQHQACHDPRKQRQQAYHHHRHQQQQQQQQQVMPLASTHVSSQPSLPAALDQSNPSGSGNFAILHDPTAARTAARQQSGLKRKRGLESSAAPSGAAARGNESVEQLSDSAPLKKQKGPAGRGCSVPEVTAAEVQQAQQSRVVFAKLRGHPAWPAQVKEPSQTQLSALTSAGQTTDGTLFVVFFGDEDYSFVPTSDILSYEQGLKKKFRLHKANKPWRAAVNKAQAYVRALIAPAEQENAEMVS